MKFWNFKNETDSKTADLLLYGPISESSWWGDEVTPLSFASDLKALGDITTLNVHINSGGGDVFAGIAIYNILKNHQATVNVHIDGLAASIASIIAMAGVTINMPTGSMMMIHNPAGYAGYSESCDLRKLADALDTIKDSLIGIYTERCDKTADEISALMDDETWLTAEMAKEYGLADEITPAIDVTNMAMEGGFFIVNSVKHDLSKLQNAKQLKKLVNKTIPSLPTNQKTKEEHKLEIKNVEDLKKAHPDFINQLVADGIKNERERITALDALNDPKNAAVVEIINDAKTNGKTAAEVEAIVNIVKKHAPAAVDLKNAQNQFKNALADNKISGVEGVDATGGSSETDEKQQDAATVNFMVGFINKKNGGKK